MILVIFGIIILGVILYVCSKIFTTKDIWLHKKYNKKYKIVTENARYKNSKGEWIDCVIYEPTFENKYDAFVREKTSFYKEFEKITD